MCTSDVMGLFITKNVLSVATIGNFLACNEQTQMQNEYEKECRRFLLLLHFLHKGQRVGLIVNNVYVTCLHVICFICSRANCLGNGIKTELVSVLVLDHFVRPLGVGVLKMLDDKA